MPPPTDEELELKQHVTKALASQGVLGKIKAQLRAAVFHVMHEHELQDDENDALLATRKKLQMFREDGDLALAIVIDFLAFFELEHSLAVLKAEANAESISTHSEVTLPLTKLRERLGGGGDDSTQRPPLLIQMLQQQQQPESSFGSCKEESSMTSGGGGAFLTSRGQMSTHETAHHKQQQQQDWEESNLPTARSSDSGFGSGQADENDVKDAFIRMKLNSERPPSSAMTTATRSSSINTKPLDYRGDEAEDSGDDEDKGDKRAASEKTKAKVESENEEDEEEIASGSELNESIAEEQSASLNYSQDYESASRDFDSDADERATRGTTASAQAAGARAAAIREEDEHGDSGDDETTTKFKTAANAGVTRGEQESDDEAAAAVPPPVPTKLSSLPSMGAPNSSTVHSEPLHDDDEFDAELEAARLSSLDAKLKAMEAEDETGTLQQLKASLQMELQHDDSDAKSRSGGGKSVATTASDKGDDEEHDGYGSDFEEEEVISEVSDDEVGSVSDLLSDNDESQVLSTLKQPPVAQPAEASEDAHTLREDRAVADENALNSYDYIEEVERDW